MKKSNMRIWDRALVALYALVGMIVTVAVAVAMCAGMQIQLLGYTVQLGEGIGPIVIVAVIAALLLVWSVRLIMIALRRAPKHDKDGVSLQDTENGAVRISMQAMQTLVRQAIGNVEGVEKIETAIVNHEDSISVNVDMSVRSDVHIPNATMMMQRSIKSFIEEYSGIAVRDVVVLVSHISESSLAAPASGEPVQETQEPKEEPAQETEVPAQPADESPADETQQFEDGSASGFMPEDDFEKMWGMPQQEPDEDLSVGEPAGETLAGEPAQDDTGEPEPEPHDDFDEKDIW